MKPISVCRFLGNKSYFTGTPAFAPAERRPPETACWCGRTQLPVGPDGEDVREERCSGGGRVCFRPQVEL